jgi:hypothetical protein
MRYVHSLAPLPSFDAKGLFGFVYGPLQEKDLEVYYIESETGHDTFTASRRTTRQTASAPPATLGPWELFGKQVIDRYLRANKKLWRRLPASIPNLGLVHSYGELLCGVARRYGFRAQDRSTFFS